MLASVCWNSTPLLVWLFQLVVYQLVRSHGLTDSHMLIIIYKSTDALTVLTPAPESRWLYLVAAVGFKVESEMSYYMY
jgi:hypothetical protein